MSGRSIEMRQRQQPEKRSLRTDHCKMRERQSTLAVIDRLALSTSHGLAIPARASSEQRISADLFPSTAAAKEHSNERKRGRQAGSKLNFHGSSFLAASSWHPRRHARPTFSQGCYEDPREDVARVRRLSRSACHAFTWLVGRRTAAVQCCPFVRVSCRFPNSTSTTHATCCGQVASILVASLSYTSDTPDFVVTCWQHPREDVTRMLRGNCHRWISARPSVAITYEQLGELMV